MPLIGVLADMESLGIKVNKSILINLDQELAAEIKILEEKIYQLAGLVFNLNSPKQLAEVLFEKLKIGHNKKHSTEAQYLNFFKTGASHY